MSNDKFQEFLTGDDSPVEDVAEPGSICCENVHPIVSEIMAVFDRERSMDVGDLQSRALGCTTTEVFKRIQDLMVPIEDETGSPQQMFVVSKEVMTDVLFHAMCAGVIITKAVEERWKT